MKKFYLPMVVFIAISIISIATPPGHSCASEINSTTTDTTFGVIPAAQNTFGYEVLIGKKVFIRQQNIPGRPGNKGFDSRADAEKVAKLAIKKMRQGIIPPTITTSELDELHIKY